MPIFQDADGNLFGPVGGEIQPPPPGDYLLDTTGAAFSAWSVARRLSSTYLGSIIRVRRVSDNTQLDIGYDGQLLDTVSLLTFCAGTDGYVHTIYDQSGNGRNLVQTVQGQQSLIVSGGALILRNLRPAMQSNGTSHYDVPASTALYNFLHNGGLSTSAGCVEVTVNTQSVIAATSGIVTGSFGYGMFMTDIPNSSLNQALGIHISRNANPFACNNRSVADSFLINTRHIVVDKSDADNATLSLRSSFTIDGGAAVENNTENGVPSASNASGNFTIMRAAVNNVGFFNMTGFWQEYVVWNSHEDQAAIYTNMNEFYPV